MKEWIRNHKGMLVIVGIGILFSMSMGGKALTKMLSEGSSAYDARLMANQVAVIYFACYAISVLALWGLSKVLDRILRG